MIEQALIEGEPYEYRADELERLVVTAADRSRGFRGLGISPRPAAGTRRFGLVPDGDGYRLSTADETAGGSVEVGAGTVGSVCFVRLDPATLTPGASAAPALVAALAAVDSSLGLGFGPLEPAAAPPRG